MAGWLNWGLLLGATHWTKVVPVLDVSGKETVSRLKQIGKLQCLVVTRLSSGSLQAVNRTWVKLLDAMCVLYASGLVPSSSE